MRISAKLPFIISASHTSVLFCPQLFIPQQQETCQDAGATFIGHSASHHVRDLTGNQACSQKPYGNGRVDLAGFQLVITKPLAEPGREYMVFDIPEKKTKVGVQICYDLNFPEISRNETLMGAEVLVKLTMDLQELYKLNEHYHYLRHLFEYNFPMPYADDFKKAPLYKEIGEGPRNVEEYDANIADVMENPIGKRAPENMDVDTWQKNLDDFLASRK